MPAATHPTPSIDGLRQSAPTPPGGRGSVVAMTTADLHRCSLATDPADRVRDTATARPSDATGRRRHGTPGTLLRAARWAADELRAGAEMSARRDAVRTADERRFLERP